MTRWSTTGLALALLVGTLLVPVDAGASTPTAPPDAWNGEYAGSGNATYNTGETGLTPANAGKVGMRWSRAEGFSSNRAPTIVGGVGYEVQNEYGAAATPTFTAFSITTGATLWTTALPTDGQYLLGVTVVGHLAVMSFDGHYQPGGVSAVDLTTHRLLWSHFQAAGVNTPAGNGNTTTGQIVSDGVRVYMFGGTNTVNTFRLSDGVPQWNVPITSNLPDGIALGNGVVYTGGGNGVIAYDSATGRKLWTAPGIGAPVVAGGRVITASGPELIAVAAAGCGGATTCSELWRLDLPESGVEYPAVGGVDGRTGYVTYTVDRTGYLVRFSAVSGRVLWKTTTLPNATVPVRGGSTVWTVAGGTTLVGWSTTATTGTPLRSIAEPADRQEGGEALAIANGTVFVRYFPRFLTAYGLPTA